jgi:hypothetical protein
MTLDVEGRLIMKPGGAWAVAARLAGLALLWLLATQCRAATDTTGTFGLAEVWPPAAGKLYVIGENTCDGTQIVDSWHPDGYEDMVNRAGMDEAGARFITALAFSVPDLEPGARVEYARLRLASAGAEIPHQLTLEIRGLLGAAGGFSDENLPSDIPRTAARVTWPIPLPWSEGSEAFPLYYTSPDISPIVNEIVSQPDFETGGGIVAFTIAGTGEATGRSNYVTIDDFARTAESYSPALLEICRDRSDTFLAEPMLGRPTDQSVTVNLLSITGIEAYAQFGAGAGTLLTGATTPVRAEAGTSLEIVIAGLDPDTPYRYRLMYRRPGETDFIPGPSGSFHTQRTPHAAYTFTIQADSHIVAKIKRRNPANFDIYRLTLENALADNPDFHISMGDFAHIELYTTRNTSSLEEGIERYLVQRRLLGDLTRQVPFFLVLGNHEAEQGWRRARDTDSLEVWGTLARKATIPNPYPDGFYSGNTDTTECCGLREDYYAWRWGDALFVVLDPFWYTMEMPHRGGPYIPTMDAWDWTLGKEQYDWLYRTLKESDARWKLVFAHHMTGGLMMAHGKDHPYGRGGIDAAKYKVSGRPSFEWGGEDETGAYVFDKKRPGWEHGPIHDILVETGVDIFFHGHDHAFVYEELDGVVYQECPVPSSAAYDTGFVVPGMYTTGIVINNSGHLRVSVSPDSLRVDYVRAVLPDDEPLKQGGKAVVNRTVSYSYTLKR